MIVDRIDRLAGRPTGIKAQVTYFVVCGVLEGGVYAALLPLLQALYGGDGHGALVWSVVACAAGIACAVANYLSETHGYMIGDVVILRSIQERLGDHIVKLPLGWFTAGRAGELAALLERRWPTPQARDTPKRSGRTRTWRDACSNSFRRSRSFVRRARPETAGKPLRTTSPATTRPRCARSK